MFHVSCFTPTGRPGFKQGEVGMHIHFEKAVRIAACVYEDMIARTSSSPDVEMGVMREWVDQQRVRSGKFVFDEYPAKALEEFGLDLLREELLQLPYPHCYFEWGYEGRRVCIFVTTVEVDRIQIWNVLIDGKQSGATRPFVFSLSKTRQRLLNGEPLIPAKHAGEYAACFDTSVRELAACIAMLSAKGTERSEVVASPEINRKRARLGRPALLSYTCIRIAPLRGRKDGGGTHASPRPHMRRGHIRRLRDEKITIVRPHFVMADPGVAPIYRVKNGGTA